MTEPVKRYCSILFLVALLAGLMPLLALSQSKDIRSQADYWPANGNLREKYEYYHDFWSERDVRHGRHSKWTKRDLLVLDGWFAEGERDSLLHRWYRNGNDREVSWWDRGQRNGVTKIYARNGRLVRESGFRSGRMHGVQYVYHRNGELKALYRYENGRRHGHGSLYDQQGKVRRQLQYEYGHLKRDRKEKKVKASKEDESPSDSLTTEKRIRFNKKPKPEGEMSTPPKEKKPGAIQPAENPETQSDEPKRQKTSQNNQPTTETQK